MKKNKKSLRIGMVIPWFGRELKGGAEQQAFQVATRLAARGHRVSVLSTCCASFLSDWAENTLPEGMSECEGVEIRRFPVDARDRPAFDDATRALWAKSPAELKPGVSPLPESMARTWTRENINSSALEAYAIEHAASCDALIFIPYLYGPTLRGLPAVAHKGWLQPCLHDESYAYLPDTARAFHAARGLLFNSAGEQELAARLFGPAVWSKGDVVGEGVEFAALDANARAQLPPQLQGRRYVLFLGRRESGKGVDLILEAHARARRLAGATLDLVLAGPGEQHYGDPGQGVHDLGLVSEEHRVALLRECAALVLPSPNESFSRVLYEAWYSRRPAIVRTSCAATSMAVEASGGGWTAELPGEWSELLGAIAGRKLSAEALAERGDAGRAYALDNADWDRVMERYEAILGRRTEIDHVVATGRFRRRASYPRAIHQLAPNYTYGDAISQEMRALRSMLLAAGYESEIIVRHIGPGLENEVRRFGPGSLRDDDALIYHHSIGSEVTAVAIAHRGPKGLLYHNITPSEFFQGYRPDFVPLLREGREDMWRLAHAFPVSAGDSRFNAEELERFGFRSPGVLPLPLDGRAWDSAPSPGSMEILADGRPNILFVGRIAPNKRQDRLVDAFAILRRLVPARLILAGSAAPGEPFAERVRQRIEAHGLRDDVIYPGHCAASDLHAFYRSAHAFWSFSEHEGFCVPLVEAMWFDVPVVAMTSSAVPETLGDAGLRFRWTDSDEQAASLVLRVLEEPDLRRRIIEGQRRRRVAFDLPHVAARLQDFVERICRADG